MKTIIIIFYNNYLHNFILLIFFIMQYCLTINNTTVTLITNLIDDIFAIRILYTVTSICDIKDLCMYGTIMK